MKINLLKENVIAQKNVMEKEKVMEMGIVKITIAAFQSGSVIITGAREILHIEKAQAFINRVFRENYELIKKVDAPFIEKTQRKNRKNM